MPGAGARKCVGAGLFGSSGFKTGPAKSPSKFGKTGVFETARAFWWAPVSGFETGAAERAHSTAGPRRIGACKSR